MVNKIRIVFCPGLRFCVPVVDTGFFVLWSPFFMPQIFPPILFVNEGLDGV